ncbi:MULTISPECIES: hypothetical protein [unclassified Lentimonas]|uniref:hypothetical protein n=1 Tax=unclassified Lentimonas TaxID=2630993 RepID=UPI00132592A1|nr:MULTISPECIES: hypothetical protein [unclassified Lentimonas]CAA6679978.1 Unannotated [Lentimonas sp. CC4]CAA6686534.1 Unannotated [Lentimonas sp. CC6]CAA7074810.1 Unannotated [Lentimonas sp. CC4]CAA7169437.1 Unannotated [Lentimonas sp. CC21]CAA7180172.1 Unannotated [Lentimonas sp. CC8]
MSFYSFFSCSVFLCLLASLCGAAPDSVAAPAYRSAIQKVDPMRLGGVEPLVAHILREYYRLSLGGIEGWQKVESLRFEGVLRMSQGALQFVAFKKKPDYCKVILFAGRERIVMSYDGADAWQLNTMESTEPVVMPPLEALNFIRDAPTAGHLLYSGIPGKQIKLLGTRVIDGYDCYDLEVTLPGGQQIVYAIDRADFVERQQIVVNAVSGAREVTTHGELSVIQGVSVPMVSTMETDSEFTHEVRMRSVEVNTGVMPWMFSRPSGLYLPGRLPEGAIGADELPAALTGSVSSDVAVAVPSADSFGLDRPGSAFNETRFPDLDAATKQSILDDIGDL